MSKSILVLSLCFCLAFISCNKKFHREIFLHPVEKNRKYGLMNENGDLVVPFKYDWIREKAVKHKTKTREFIAYLNKKQGLLDSAGKVIFECEYDHLESVNALYSDTVYGYYLADKNEESYILSPKEKKAYKMETRVVYDLENGIFVSYDSVGKFGLINYDGSEVLPHNYQYVVPIRSNNAKWIAMQKKLAGINISEEYLYIRQNDKEGIADQKGNIIIPPRYDEISLFVNGRATFSDINEIGIVDSSGNELLRGEYSYIDYIGKALKLDYWQHLPSYYSSVFYEKCFRYSLNNSNYPFRLEKGDTVEFRYSDNRIQSINDYENVSIFKNDYAIARKNGKVGLLDTNFNQIIPCVYDRILNYNKHTFPAKYNNKWGTVNKNNEVITPFIYDSIAFTELYTFFFQNPPFAFKKGDCWNLIDANNKILTDFCFTEAPMRRGINWYDRETQFIEIKTEIGNGLIDNNGKIIIPPNPNYVSFDIYKDIILVHTKSGYGNSLYDYSGNQIEFEGRTIYSETIDGVFQARDKKKGITHFYRDYRTARGKFIWDR